MIKIRQGIDIVEIGKLQNVMGRHDSFVSDIFTNREQQYCLSRKEPLLHFAGRFAAKESYLKALGTGFSGPGIDHVFREIEVLPSNSGSPGITVSGWIAKIAKKKRIDQCCVSISHSGSYAVASVILTGTD